MVEATRVTRAALQFLKTARINPKEDCEAVAMSVAIGFHCGAGWLASLLAKTPPEQHAAICAQVLVDVPGYAKEMLRDNFSDEEIAKHEAALAIHIAGHHDGR